MLAGPSVPHTQVEVCGQPSRCGGGGGRRGDWEEPAGGGGAGARSGRRLSDARREPATGEPKFLFYPPAPNRSHFSAIKKIKIKNKKWYEESGLEGIRSLAGR